ncbi:MAG: hypothetical protein Q9M35_08010 [Rhodothermus sp.]|nr:hypothetical protein [Rhodothermus sp.]
MERQASLRRAVQQRLFGFGPRLFEKLLRTTPPVATVYLQAGASLQEGVLPPLAQQACSLP